MNSKLDWTDHTAATYKKGHIRLHLLRELWFFGLQGALLTSFYDCGGISHFLWSSLLEQQHLSSRQKET